jgi:hypothetical protein
MLSFSSCAQVSELCLLCAFFDETNLMELTEFFFISMKAFTVQPGVRLSSIVFTKLISDHTIIKSASMAFANVNYKK